VILFTRSVCCAAAFIWLIGMESLIHAEGTNAPDSNPQPTHTPLALPWLSKPMAPTNSVSSSFLDSHPELTQPIPSEQGLSLHQDTTPLDNTGIVSDLSAHLTNQPGQPENLTAHLLVVYNQDDPDSKELATYYATKRGIAADHILSIACPTNEEITRTQYEETIREPIMTYMSQKNWIERQSTRVRVGNRILDLLVANYNHIWAIVLIRGVPLKIAPESSHEAGLESAPEWATNAAAVDSELALLPIFGLPTGGFMPNSFFDEKMTGLHRAGPDLAKRMIMVTRLDGPKPEDVRRMIDDSLYAEKNRLAGLAVVDSRGLTDVKDPYLVGDNWLRRAHDLLTGDGWCVKFDDKLDTIPATDPCDQVALYLGWYKGDALGPWITPPNRFVPGAIAYHLHSFSASTVRSETVGWVGPLISHGAAATMGMVYEPYLDMTPHTDIFTKRLLDGNSFAEAVYASIKGLSWMVTVVGDPLYQPFRRSLPDALADTSMAHSDHHDWLLLQKTQRAFATGKMPPSTDALQHSLDTPETGPVALEGLGDLLEKSKDPSAGLAAEKAYKKAMTLGAAPMDQIRIGLKLAQHYADHKRDDQAQAELRLLAQIYPQDAPRFGVTDRPAPVAIPIPPTDSAIHNQFWTPQATQQASSPNMPPGPPRPPGPSKP